MIRTNSAKNTIGNPSINHKFAELVATFRQQRGRIASKSEVRSFFTDEVDSCRTSAPLHRNKNLVFEFLFTHGWRQGAQQGRFNHSRCNIAGQS